MRLPKYRPPIPLTARRVRTPRLWCGGRTHSLGGEGGWGGQYFGRRRHSSVLYMCKYFVGLQYVLIRNLWLYVAKDIYRICKGRLKISFTVEKVLSGIIPAGRLEAGETSSKSGEDRLLLPLPFSRLLERSVPSSSSSLRGLLLCMAWCCFRFPYNSIKISIAVYDFFFVHKFMSLLQGLTKTWKTRVKRF
jgi:hypothetical protein